MAKVTPYRCDRAVAALDRVIFSQDYTDRFTDEERIVIAEACHVIGVRGRQILTELLDGAVIER